MIYFVLNCHGEINKILGLSHSSWALKKKRLLFRKEGGRRERERGTILRSKYKEIIGVQGFVRDTLVRIPRTRLSNIRQYKFQAIAEINQTVNKFSSRSIL